MDIKSFKKTKIDLSPLEFIRNGACSIGIIGGADGPTAVFVSDGQNSEHHRALSALRFEYADDIEWKIVFREKLMEDTETELL